MLKCLLLLLPFTVLIAAKTLEPDKESFKDELNVDLTDQNQTMRQNCPSISDLPIVTRDGTEFIAIRSYFKKGNAIPELSCNGDYVDVLSGYRVTVPEGNGIPMGSLFVHAGCTFYGFKDYDCGGKHKEYEGPLFLSDGPDTFGRTCGDDHVPCVHSYVVDCKQQMPDCVPEDKWTTVADFDNTGSSLTSKFTYKYTIGTSWSDEMSEGFDVSTTVGAEMQNSFWGSFGATIGVSRTTGYNWGQVSTQAKQESREYTVEAEVPGGKRIQIQQITGSCGLNGVGTEKIRQVDHQVYFLPENYNGSTTFGEDKEKWKKQKDPRGKRTPRQGEIPCTGSSSYYTSAPFLVLLTSLSSLLSQKC